MLVCPVSRVSPFALGLAATLCIAASSEAQQLRFTTTAPGGIASTGNTLGLSKAFGVNGPGIEDSIGTFISLSPTFDDQPAHATNPWPAYTTWDWMQNGSEAVLSLPLAAEVLYAELVWAGSYAYQEDVSAHLDTAVTLGVGSTTMSVTPDPSTAQTFAETSYTGFAANYYIRSADVTSFVALHKSGTYRVEGVPATQGETINSLNAAGWSLVVAYRGEDQPVRNLSVFVGGSFVDEDAQQDYTVDGFCAPPSGVVEGHIVISALEGDADLTGDELLIGETNSGPFAVLSGPNNPAANFFCSQLNDASGQLDTAGSFGTVNHDAFGGTNVVGGRQGWDHTTVQLSSTAGHLVNEQTSAVVRTNTTGDSFVPTLVALEIDVKSPTFTTGSSTTADKSLVTVGDTIQLTAVLSNTGQARADNLLLVMPVEPGLELASYLTDSQPGDIDGNPVLEADLASGVPAGQLAMGESREVIMTFDVVGAPENGVSFILAPVWEHSFEMCANQPIGESHRPAPAIVAYEGESGGAGGAGGAGGQPPEGGSAPEGQGGGSSGAGNLETSGAPVDHHGGCGCQLPGGANRERGALALALALFALQLRRRRDAQR